MSSADKLTLVDVSLFGTLFAFSVAHVCQRPEAVMLDLEQPFGMAKRGCLMGVSVMGCNRARWDIPQPW